MTFQVSPVVQILVSSDSTIQCRELVIVDRGRIGYSLKLFLRELEMSIPSKHEKHIPIIPASSH